jgi:hypothetical protein
MASTLTLYNDFKLELGKEGHNFSSDALKLMLVTSAYTPNYNTHTQKSDITNELSAANGYTAGGYSLSTVTWAMVSNNARLDFADLDIEASGGSLVFRRGIIYNDSNASDKLIADILFDNTPADITITTGNIRRLKIDVNGLLELQ